jgi:hypothetical protein
VCVCVCVCVCVRNTFDQVLLILALLHMLESIVSHVTLKDCLITITHGRINVSILHHVTNSNFCALKFYTPILMSNNTFEMSSIFMLVGFIMIFKMKATFLTSNPVTSKESPMYVLNNTTHYYICKQCPMKIYTQMFLHAKLCPMMSLLQNVDVSHANMISKSHLPKFCLFHLPLVHIISRVVVMHKFKVVFPIVIYAIPNHSRKLYRPSFIDFLHKKTP